MSKENDLVSPSSKQNKGGRGDARTRQRKSKKVKCKKGVSSCVLAAKGNNVMSARLDHVHALGVDVL